MKKVINFLKEPFVKNGMGLAFIIGAVIAGIIMVIVEYDNPRFITFIIVPILVSSDATPLR
jgi:hypothetical protein